MFVSGVGRNRASCSCGWDGPLRALRSPALLDAYRHGGQGIGCLPSAPLVVDERAPQSLWKRLTPWWVWALCPLLLILVAIWSATPSHAAPPGCEQIPWGFLGSQQRLICDGPIRPDGSWERERVIAVPAHYQNATSHCYSSGYSSDCSFSPAGWVNQVTIEDTSYVVFPDNVLGNEPGHLG